MGLIQLTGGFRKMGKFDKYEVVAGAIDDADVQSEIDRYIQVFTTIKNLRHIHLAFVIVFSTMWGLITHEWKGSSKRTMKLIFTGILILMLSTVVMGFGNYLAGTE